MECNIFIFLYYLHVYICLQFDLKYNAHSMQLQEKKVSTKGHFAVNGCRQNETLNSW